MSAAMAAAATAATPAARVAQVYNRLGAWSGNLLNPIEAKIEAFFIGLGAPVAIQAAKASTKYAGFGGLSMPVWNVPAALSPTMLIAGQRIGLDKLGHFFQQGYAYFQRVRAGQTLAQVVAWGKATEAGDYGLSSSGVYSRGDLEANLQGYNFYNSLFTTVPFPRVFTPTTYINAKWNELSNPNDYHKNVVDRVWANILSITARRWTGTLGLETGVTVPITFTWTRANPANDATGRPMVSGTYAYTNPTAGPLTGTVSARVLPFVAAGQTSTPTALLHVSWGRGRNSGKAVLLNVGGEKRLKGTWGRGQQYRGGGTLDLTAP
ncbi:MAG: hypothetical protein AAF721_04465 [Myxococcota bacterium]